MHEYYERHGVESASVLTVVEDDLAGMIAEHLSPRITGKIVVEIGGGIGLLACHLGVYAKRVFCIEANPVWSDTFVKLLLEKKPPNVSYLFGTAAEFAGVFTADVALFATHSGVSAMKEAGHLFAPQVIDIYGEILADAKPGKFDPVALALRLYS